MFKNTLRKHLEKTFPQHELARWYDPLELEVDETRQVISVAFPHAFFADWFMATARPQFEAEVCAVSTGMPIIYKNGAKRAQIFSQPGEAKIENTGQAARPSSSPLSTRDRPENSNCTLANFLVNKKNDFPLAAAIESVEKATCPPYTPFVIYGHSGVGKTHLLSAMANAVRKKGLRCLFSDISFLESAQFYKGNFFSLPEQCLFIDDMQRIGSMPDMQDSFAALIDAFSSANKLLALSFDCHPSVCAGLGQKLKSRLTAGLVVEIKRPDLDIRRQYAQRKNEAGDLKLGKEDILLLAQRYQEIRSIDGALTRLAAYRSLMPTHEAGSREQDISAILSRGMEQTVLTPQIIIMTTARAMSLSPEDLIGKSRDKNTTLARHMAIVLCRELLGLSLVQIGRIFGGRDHSSILYSIKKVKALQAGNKDMNKKLDELRKQCLTGH